MRALAAGDLEPPSLSSPSSLSVSITSVTRSLRMGKVCGVDGVMEPWWAKGAGNGFGGAAGNECVGAAVWKGD